MNHVSVSPTDGNGPKVSYKVRREQVVGTEDVKVTAMTCTSTKRGYVFTNFGRVALIF